MLQYPTTLKDNGQEYDDGHSWLAKLTAISEKPTRLVAGVMSGTSMDSIDVALCEVGMNDISKPTDDSRIRLISFHQQPYDRDLAARLKTPALLTVRDVSELHVLVGEAFAQACLAALRQAGVDVRDMDLIGSHGQTVYHHSTVRGTIRSTLQLGDIDVIAERTGIGVIGDFRARDIAAGGEGAPLTPYADVVLYRLGSAPHRAVLNMGGIANITFVERGPNQDVIGFDTGPANAPLDRLARHLTGGRQEYDIDGGFARAGVVNEDMLGFLLQDDYLAQPPPKSTGFEMYGDEFIERLISNFGSPNLDTMTTVTEFVARTISDALQRHVCPRADVSDLVLAGGGGRNPELRRRLALAITPISLIDSDVLGVPAQAREAMAFALLANDALLGLPTSIPSVTGARQAAVLGKLAFPA